MTGSPRSGDPTLALRLPGIWVQLDPRQPAVTQRRIRTYADLALGRADHLAAQRADLRRSLTAMLDAAGPASALQVAFVCHEVSRGTPTPMVVSIFTPAEVRLAPVAGHEPDVVIEGFMAAMRVLEARPPWERIECADGVAARRWRIDEMPLAQESADTVLRSFVADYWRTVPHTSRLTLVTVTSPLADIPQTMLRFADAIVAGSRFVAPDRGDASP